MRIKSEQIQLEEWIKQKDWDVFGTLKFQPIRMIGGDYASQLIAQYWNKLDRVLYGKAVELGCRVERWCFAHEGSHNDNFHLHFVAKSPIEPDLFCCLSNTLWTKHHCATETIKRNWITPVISRDRVAHYLTKEVWKLGDCSFDERFTCEPKLAYEPDPLRDEAQEKRVLKAMTKNELRAAQVALAKHKEATERRLALRDRKLSGKATRE